MDMDGGNVRIIITDVPWINGVAVDVASDRLYLAEAKEDVLYVADLDGHHRRPLLRGIVKHPFSLAVFEDQLYWSDWEAREVQTCNKYTGKGLTTLVKGLSQYPMGVSVHHPLMHPRDAWNSCAFAGCSHLCLRSPTGHSCKCPTGWRLAGDVKTCLEVTTTTSTTSTTTEEIPAARNMVTDEAVTTDTSTASSTSVSSTGTTSVKTTTRTSTTVAETSKSSKAEETSGTTITTASSSSSSSITTTTEDAMMNEILPVGTSAHEEKENHSSAAAKATSSSASSYTATIIIVLVIILIFLVIGLVLYRRRNGGLYSSAFFRHTSTTTLRFRNPNFDQQPRGRLSTTGGLGGEELKTVSLDDTNVFQSPTRGDGGASELLNPGCQLGLHHAATASSRKRAASPVPGGTTATSGSNYYSADPLDVTDSSISSEDMDEPEPANYGDKTKLLP